jgi:hypothetical protein
MVEVVVHDHVSQVLRPFLCPDGAMGGRFYDATFACADAARGDEICNIQYLFRIYRRSLNEQNTRLRNNCLALGTISTVFLQAFRSLVVSANPWPTDG